MICNHNTLPYILLKIMCTVLCFYWIGNTLLTVKACNSQVVIYVIYDLQDLY